MQFKNAVIWLSRLYKFFDKMGFNSFFDIDNHIDNNMPQFLSRLQTYANLKKISVMGTNGKRTLVHIFNQILQKNDNSFYTNITKEGKRYPAFASIVMELSDYIQNYGLEYKKEYYTMAFDEFELESYFNSMKFDKLLLSNLFYDHKDFTTLNKKRKLIQGAISLNSKLDLIINADEPLFYKIDEIKNDTAQNKKRNKLYYGFDEITFFENDEKYIQDNDILSCPVCGCKLDYKKRHYSHLGIYNCDCGYKRPPLDIRANARIYKDYCFLDCFYQGDKLSFKVPLGGVYNAYNALGAIALAIDLKIHRKTIIEAFDKYKPLRAHDEIINYKNRNIKIKIAKNPVSLAENIKELRGDDYSKVVLCLNDDTEDGKDTSWIWNANFNALSGFENKIYCCSKRFDDMALRLKYANVNPSLIIMDSSIKRAIECCYYDLEDKESMLIVSSPSLIDEIYSVLNC